MEDVVIVFFFVAIFFHFTNVKVKVKLIGERLEASNHGSLSISSINSFPHLFFCILERAVEIKAEKRVG